MTSRTVRRRLYHGDVDGKRNEHFDSSGMDSLDEPLLENNDYNNDRSMVSTFQDLLVDERGRQQLHWVFLFSNVISQWAQWLGIFTANLVLGSGSLIGRLFPISSTSQTNQSHGLLLPSLSPLQEERLAILRERLQVPFDWSRTDHQDALKQLWRLAYPDRVLPSLKTELWKDMGWQGSDPSTDFRGGGFKSLENLIYFAKQYPESFQSLLHKKDGTRAEWEYPFSVAGVNISFMLVQMLDLQSEKPTSRAGVRFLELLAVDEMAFDNLFCVVFQMMDSEWLAMRASYMEFNDVLKSTRTQLERELTLEDVKSIQDLPAYNLLRR